MLHHIILVFFLFRHASCWTTDDLAMFDLVEELNLNFYQFLGVSQDASTGDIKRAYRQMSMQWHPDKNSDPEAADMFRKIAAVYEILKNEEQRKAYENVLEWGLPDWKQPIFYYRTVRKMPAWELGVIVVLIFTLTHYLMRLGAYYEKRYALQESLSSKLKRQEKRLRRKHNVDVDDLIEESINEQLEPKPGFTDLLPFVVCRCVRHLSCEVLPELIKDYAAARNAAAQQENEDEVVETKPVRKRIYIEEVQYEVADDIKPVLGSVDADFASTRPVELITGPWGIEELNNLIKLSTEKFPIGTVNRWDKIAEQLNRKPDDVTKMIGKLKHMDPDDYHKLCKPVDGPAKYMPDLSASGPNPQHMQPSTNFDAQSAAAWSQATQSQFETALAKYGKEIPDRWARIASEVDDKSADECMARYKVLVAMVRQRKGTKAAAR